MSKFNTRNLLLALILACICVPAFSAEPNQLREELKFELSDQKIQWRTAGGGPGVGPIEPNYVAIVYIQDRVTEPYFRNPDVSVASRIWHYQGPKGMLDTSAGLSMSRQQQDFLSTSDAFIEQGYDKKIRNYSEFRLFAVNQEDAKKMTRAFLEVLDKKSETFIQECRDRLKKSREKLAYVKETLPERRTQMSEAESKYRELYSSRYIALGEPEAREQAKQTILQMDKMLDNIEIELAGIRKKLEVIEKYQMSKRSQDGKLFSEETQDRLDQMYIEQIVELMGIEARKEATNNILKREKEFIDLFNQWTEIIGKVSKLERDLKRAERNIPDFENLLANPIPDMLPSNVYQNTVIIYPVQIVGRN